MTTENSSDHDKRLSLAERSIESVERTMDAVNSKIDLILAKINSVAILEEKHQTQSADITRAHERIGKLDDKHETLAIESREFMNYSKGQAKVLWALGAVVAMLLIKVMFFAAASGMAPP